MKQHLIKALGLAVIMGFLAAPVLAQDNNESNESKEQEIIIKPKPGKDAKVTIEVEEDGDVKVNGEPLSEYDGEDVSIRKRDSRSRTRIYAPGSPFRGGANSFGNQFFWDGDQNKAFLGVLTEKSENGAKVKSVTKGSAAEKAGLKEGDVITKIDDTKVEDPQDLIEAVAKLKPEQSATISYKRNGKKEVQTKAVLGKRGGDVAIFNSPDFRFNPDMNFDHNFDLNLDRNNRLFGYLDSRNPKLGIKAQDTEDGKGVKVVDVDDESNAERAGIKEGDIITSFDGTEVNSAGALADAAREAKDKSSVRVKLTRDGKSQEIEIKVPKKLKTADL